MLVRKDLVRAIHDMDPTLKNADIRKVLSYLPIVIAHELVKPDRLGRVYIRNLGIFEVRKFPRKKGYIQKGDRIGEMFFSDPMLKAAFKPSQWLTDVIRRKVEVDDYVL